jgi:hypothetical protein
MPDSRSLYDLFGVGFTLVVLGDTDDTNVAEAELEAQRTNTPLHIVRLSDKGLIDLYQARLVLIRPDQYIAWRGERWPGNELLLIVSGRRNSPLDKTATVSGGGALSLGDCAVNAGEN